MQVLATNALLVIAIIVAIIFTSNPLALAFLYFLQIPPPPKYTLPGADAGETDDPVGQIGFVHDEDMPDGEEPRQ